MIDALTVLGVGVVLPLALGGALLAWAVATAGVALALALPSGGAAALLVVPLLAVAATLAWRRLRATGPGLLPAASTLAAGYAVVAACSLLASRAGLSPFGIGEPIVQLTAVHYAYAGSAALVLAVRAFETAPARLRSLAGAGIVLTAMAPPVVAAGFVTASAVPQVGGAVLMALGVFATGALHLHAAAQAAIGPAAARLLLGVSGLSILIPMVLAVAWAAGQHWDVPALSIDDMARTHGVANAVGFTVGGLTGRRIGRPQLKPVAG